MQLDYENLYDQGLNKLIKPLISLSKLKFKDR